MGEVLLPACVGEFGGRVAVGVEHLLADESLHSLQGAVLHGVSGDGLVAGVLRLLVDPLLGEAPCALHADVEDALCVGWCEAEILDLLLSLAFLLPVLEVLLHAPGVEVPGGLECDGVVPITRWPTEALNCEIDGLARVVPAHDAVAADLLKPRRGLAGVHLCIAVEHGDGGGVCGGREVGVWLQDDGRVRQKDVAVAVAVPAGCAWRGVGVVWHRVVGVGA